MAADTISFARGAPSADIMPAEAVREAAARALASDWERALSYGTGIGHPALCEWIASELHGIDAGQVMVTNGSMEAAALLFRYMVDPGDRVIVEQPSYDRTLLLLGRTGAELIGVPLEADGIDIGGVEAALADGPVSLIHVIPNFHNPAGCTLSAAKRERLLQLADEHGFRIFEDDPYRLINFGGDLPPTMLSADGADRVIHASSFSKTVSPGVRVGYLAGPPDQIATLAKRGSEHYIAEHARGVDRARLCRSGALTENVEFVNGALAGGGAMRSSGRSAEPDPGSRFRRSRAATPVARSKRGHRHSRGARRRQGRGGRVRGRPRLHARGRRVEPAPLVRERARRARRRGRRAARPRA